MLVIVSSLLVIMIILTNLNLGTSLFKQQGQPVTPDHLSKGAFSECRICKYQPCFKVLCDSQYGFWWRNGFYEWETNTVDEVLELSKDTRCLISIGEWIGPVVLPLASIRPDMEIYVFDIDSISNSDLLVNQRLNNFTNLHIQMMGVSNKTHFPMLNIQGDSMSSHAVLSDRKYVQWHVPVIDLRELSDLVRKENCVFKIDTEGHEEFLFNRLIELKPKGIHLSMHHSSPHHEFVINKSQYEADLLKLVNIYKTPYPKILDGTLILRVDDFSV